MNRTRNLTSVKLVLLALLATVVSAGVLSAEDFAGKFTLPFEARWGMAVLPAGDYEFRLDTATSAPLVRVTGKTATAQETTVARPLRSSNRGRIRS